MHSSDTTAVCTNIAHTLAQLPSAQSGCTIYKVHRHLRNINPKAYEPMIVAIGPYHRDKDHLKMMEEHKFRYLRILLQRNQENLERYVSAIKELEKEARNCYAEHIPLSPEEFVEMLVLDGCFIIELVRKFNYKNLLEENDPIFNMSWITMSMQRDLILFENQIPFFILRKLFDLTEVPNEHHCFMRQLFGFFYNLYQGKVGIPSDRCPCKIRHLLDLIHNNCLPSDHLLNMGRDANEARKVFQVINNASALREANVKFKSNESGAAFFDVSFENGTLLFPPLRIDDVTESLFRNLIAYEQYFKDFQFNFVTDYATFMDFLIDSSKDVEILSSRGIITNWLGDDKVVANMFNKLGDSAVCEEHFLYGKLIDDVNIYCNKHRNKWMAKLRRNYWNSPWVVLPILVAVLILLLTITQTVFTILQVV